MGWQDRDYAQEDAYRKVAGGRASIVPATWSICTILLIINVALFLLAPVRGEFFGTLVLHSPSVLHGQVWRLVSACFLHWSGDHIFWNMLGLYFFGPYLERSWGRRKFLTVYLISGAAANLIYVLLYLVGWKYAAGVAAGASGCVYAVLGACAVLLPQIRVLVFFILPLKIRTFLLIFLCYGLLNATRGGANAGGDAVHIAGILLGAAYAWWDRRGSLGLHQFRVKPVAQPKKKKGAWSRKLEKESQLQEELDRILAKIQEQGLAGLTAREKEILARASKRQQDQDADFERSKKL